MAVRVNADVLNLTETLTKEIVLGAKQVQALKVPFNSNTNSNLSLNYSVAPRAVITNEWYLEVPMILRVSAPAGAVPAGEHVFSHWGDNSSRSVALRNFPLLWAMNNVQVKLNSNIFNTELKRLMPAFSKLMSNQDATEYADVGPALPDQGFFSYGDSAGTLQNVLSGFSDSRENWVPRGSWDYIGVAGALLPGNNDIDPAVPPTQTLGYVKVKFTCPLIASPLYNPAIGNPILNLTNLSTINIDITLDGTFVKCMSVPTDWSCDAVGINNVFGSASNNVNLLMVSSYPQDYQGIPAETKYPVVYYDIKTESINPVPTAIRNADGTLTPGKVSKGSTNIFQFDQYPDTFIFYASKQVGLQTASDADVFFKWGDGSTGSGQVGFQLQINGDSTLLNGYSDSQLYQLVKKYARVSYNEFRGYAKSVLNNVLAERATSGSPLVLRSGIDFPISNASVAPGMPYKIQLNFSNLNIWNYSITPDDITGCEIGVIAIRSGEFTLTPSSGSQMSNIVSQADVISALEKEPVYASEVAVMEGGMRKSRKDKMKLMLSGSARSGGARSAGKAPLNTAVPKTHTSRF